MPVVSARNVQAAPSYNFFQSFRRNLLAKRPDAVLIVLVPKIGEVSRWQHGADWSGDRTHVIEVEMMESQFDDLTLVTRDFFDRFNERFGDTYFDVIFTEKPSLAPMLRKLAAFHLDSKSRKPLVLCRDQMTLSVEWFKVNPVDEMLQAVGHSQYPTIFQSPHQMKYAVGVARKHLQPAHIQRMIDRSAVFPLGIDCDDVDSINMEERSDKLERVTVNYSHKLFLEQKFLESLSIMDSTFAGGRDIGLQIVTGSSSAKMHMLKKAHPYLYMTIFGSMNRREFLKQMARAHVFISNSYYEDFSATVVEQMYSGLIPVLIDEEWSRYLVGDDYPYLFRSQIEGNAMLRYVIDNYEKVRDEVVPGLQQRVREKFDLKNIVPDMVDWVLAHHEQRIAGLPKGAGSLIPLMEQVYDVLPEQFGEEQVYAAIKQCADNLDVTNQKVESRATSPWLCLDLMRMNRPMVDLGGMPVTWKKGEISAE